MGVPDGAVVGEDANFSGGGGESADTEELADLAPGCVRVRVLNIAGETVLYKTYKDLEDEW